MQSIALYWEQDRPIPDLSAAGFYTAGWFSAFERLGIQVIRKSKANFFNDFAPGVADWHLLFPGTPRFVEGGDFSTFTPPTEGKRAILLEEDLHYNLHHLILFSRVYDLVILHDYVLWHSLKALGIPNVLWVPSSYDPEIFKPLPGDRPLDIAFLGDPGKYYQKKGLVRSNFLGHLDSKFPNPKKIIGRNFYGPAANDWYNRAKILIDLPTYENVGPRVPQCMGTGRMLLMNRLTTISPSHTHGLHDGVHYATFDGTLEGLDRQIQWFLSHPEEREKIAEAGQIKAGDFTYTSSAQKIAEEMSR